MPISRRTRTAIAAVVMLVGTTACGNSSSDKDTAATTTKAETTTTSAEASTTSESESESSSAAAEERAEAANLTLDDLPDGWTSTPNGEENDSNVFDTCGDLDLDEITVAKVSSDNFEYATSDGGGLTLTTTLGVFDSEENAQAMVDIIGEQAFADCTTTAMADLAAVPGMTGSVAPTPTGELPDVADQVGALSGEFTIPTPQGNSTMRVMLIAVRTGDLVTTISGTAIDTEPDGALMNDVVNLVDDRQAD